RTLCDWIAMLPEEVRRAQPRLLYWLGSALATHDPREARAPLVAAFEAFARGGDAIGRALCASGIIYTYYLDMAELREMDPWIEELHSAIDARLAFPTPGIELHVHAALLFAQGFRHLDPRRIEETSARMFVLLDHKDIPANAKVAAAAILLFD